MSQEGLTQQIVDDELANAGTERGAIFNLMENGYTADQIFEFIQGEDFEEAVRYHEMISEVESGIIGFAKKFAKIFRKTERSLGTDPKRIENALGLAVTGMFNAEIANEILSEGSDDADGVGDEA